MKIAAITYIGLAGPYVIMDLGNAFTRLGHEVIQVKAQDMVNLGSQVSGRALLAACSDVFKGCDFVYGYGAVPLISVDLGGKPVSVFEELGIQYCSIYYDSPFEPSCLTEEAREYHSCIHHRFVWDEYYAEEMRKLGFNNVHYMPIGTDVNRYSPPETTEYDCDVSFVGNHSPMREIVMRSLVKHNPKIYGINWKERASSDVASMYVKHADNVTELPSIYARSKINVNVTMPQGISSVNMRVFDCIASGGFVLTDYKPELSLHFNLDKEVVCYYNHKQIPELVEYYLEREDERKEIIAAGRKRILEEHTYDIRAEYIVEKIKNINVLSGDKIT